MEWQPIETAPKDGTSILAVDADGDMGVVWWNSREQLFEDVQCLIDDDGMLTHWIPLPKAPNAALRGDSGLIAGVPLESTVRTQEVE